MMWLARYCENMTKKAIAKEKEQKALAEANATQSNSVQAAPQTQSIGVVASNKPTMAGFLNK